MKTPPANIFSIIVLFASSNAPLFAQEKRQPLADDIETSDPLIHNVDPVRHDRQYGEKDIYISGEGDRENQLVTPDVLEQTLDDQASGAAASDVSRDIKLEPREPMEEDKAIETPDHLLKIIKEGITGNGNERKNEDLVTPDPLLDSVN